jgi:phage/plasmid-like protein (TIGR03299 family)
MAHNININNGKASFFTVKEKAWHSLGQVLEACPTAEEAIIHAGLNYEVIKVPNFALVNNEFIPTPGSFSTVRGDNNIILGDKIGKIYEIVQNREAFGFFDAIVGEGEAIYETAGALGKGETIFITAKLPGYISVKNDDIEKYLLLTMSHNGTGSIQAMFTPIRVVCNNTLNAALRGVGHKVSIRHTRNVTENLREAHKVLGIANKLSEELGTIFNKLSKVKVDSVLLKSYIEESIVPIEMLNAIRKGKAEFTTNQIKTFESIQQYMVEGPGQDLITARGTMYGAYNAITGYYSNVKEYTTDTSKLKTMYFGDTQNIMQRAFDLAVNIN